MLRTQSYTAINQMPIVDHVFRAEMPAGLNPAAQKRSIHISGHPPTRAPEEPPAQSCSPVFRNRPCPAEWNVIPSEHPSTRAPEEPPAQSCSPVFRNRPCPAEWNVIPSEHPSTRAPEEPPARWGWDFDPFRAALRPGILFSKLHLFVAFAPQKHLRPQNHLLFLNLRDAAGLFSAMKNPCL
jgi:hypothetical protein